MFKRKWPQSYFSPLFAKQPGLPAASTSHANAFSSPVRFIAFSPSSDHTTLKQTKHCVYTYARIILQGSPVWKSGLPFRKLSCGNANVLAASLSYAHCACIAAISTHSTYLLALSSWRLCQAPSLLIIPIFPRSIFLPFRPQIVPN